MPQLQKANHKPSVSNTFSISENFILFNQDQHTHIYINIYIYTCIYTHTYIYACVHIKYDLSYQTLLCHFSGGEKVSRGEQRADMDHRGHGRDESKLFYFLQDCALFPGTCVDNGEVEEVWVPRHGSFRGQKYSRGSLNLVSHCHEVPVGSDSLPCNPTSSLTSCVSGSQFPPSVH